MYLRNCFRRILTSWASCNRFLFYSVSVQAEVDELGVPEGCPTVSHESIVGELHSPPVDKSESFETSELEAGYDLREDISDSEDGRLSDHHNSYCQYCRQGGELL